MPQLQEQKRPTPEAVKKAYRQQYITVGERNEKLRSIAADNLNDAIGENGVVKTYFTQTVKLATQHWNEFVDIASKHDPEKSAVENLKLPLRLMWQEIQFLAAPLTAFGEVNGETVKQWALDAGASPGFAKVIGLVAEMGSGFVPIGKLSQSFAKGVQQIGAAKAAKGAAKAEAAAADANVLAQAEKVAEATINQGLAADGVKVAGSATTANTTRKGAGVAGAAIEAEANGIAPRIQIRKPQDILTEMEDRLKNNFVQGNLRTAQGSGANVTIERNAADLAKNPAALSDRKDMASLLAFDFFQGRSDPRKAIESIITSDTLRNVTMEEKAALVQYLDRAGAKIGLRGERTELSRLLEPDQLDAVRNWYKSILPEPSLKLPPGVQVGSFSGPPKNGNQAFKVAEPPTGTSGAILPPPSPSIADDFWQRFNEIKKELAGITETKSFKMASEAADKLGLDVDDIRKLFPGKAINDIEVVALLKALGTADKAGTPVANWVAKVKAFDPDNPATVDDFLNGTLDIFGLTTKMRTTNVTAGRSVKYFDQAPANKAINELLRHWDSEAMAKMDRTAAAQTMVEDIRALVAEPGKLETLAVLANDAVVNSGPNAWAKIREAYTGLLLLRPVTWTKQFLGNTAAVLNNVVEKEVGAFLSLDAKKGLVQGEGLESLKGMQMAVAEAADAYLAAFNRNPSAQSRLDFPVHQIGGAFGRVINFGHDNVMGIDNFTKVLISNGEKYASAFREAAHLGYKPGSAKYIDYVTRRRIQPTTETSARVADIANSLTFQSELGYYGKLAQRGLQAGPLILWFPFVKSGMNLVKWGWNRTPGLQFVSRSLYEDILAGGVRADMAVARLTLANVFGQFYYSLAQTGMITGGGPIDSALRRSWLGTHEPYSARGGDGRWYSYANTVEPGTTPLEMIADFAEIHNQLDEMTAEQAGMAIVLTIVRDVMNNTWWQNAGKIAQLFATIQSGETLKRPATELLFSPVTALATGGPLGLAVERNADPVRREARSWMDNLRKGPFARVFGYSEQMPPLRDGYGDPVLVPQAVGSTALRETMALGSDMLAGLNNIGNPFVVNPGEVDRIKIEGDRLQIKMPPFPWSTGGGAVRDDFDLRAPLPGEAVPVPITAQQRDRWIRIYRDFLRTVNGGIEKQVLDDPKYQNAPIARQRDLFANYLAKSRDLAKKALLIDDTELAKTVAEHSAAKYLPMLQPTERAKVEGDIKAAIGLIDQLAPKERENLLKIGVLDSRAGDARDEEMMSLRRFSTDTPGQTTIP